MTKSKDAARKAAERYCDGGILSVLKLARLLRAYGKREYERGRYDQCVAARNRIADNWERAGFTKLEVLVEAVRAEFAKEVSNRLRLMIRETRLPDQWLQWIDPNEAADIVESLARPTTRLVHENGTQLQEPAKCHADCTYECCEPAPAECKHEETEQEFGSRDWICRACGAHL